MWPAKVTASPVPLYLLFQHDVSDQCCYKVQVHLVIIHHLQGIDCARWVPAAGKAQPLLPWNSQNQGSCCCCLFLLPGSEWGKQTLLPWNRQSQGSYCCCLALSEAPSHEPTSNQLSSLSSSCTSKVFSAFSCVIIVSSEQFKNYHVMTELSLKHLHNLSPHWWARDWQFVFR